MATSQEHILLFSQLSEGSLEDNCVVDGSRITLLPRAETGLLVSQTFFFNLVNIPRARENLSSGF